MCCVEDCSGQCDAVEVKCIGTFVMDKCKQVVASVEVIGSLGMTSVTTLVCH